MGEPPSRVISPNSTIREVLYCCKFPPANYFLESSMSSLTRPKTRMASKHLLHLLVLALAAIQIYAVPRLRNVACTPSTVPLGRSVNITWSLTEDESKPSRGVVSWQVYAQNAVTQIDGEDEETPITGPASVSELSDDGITADLDYYRYGPYGVVNYTGQPLCLTTSMPYGKNKDSLGNPEGYSSQTFCPLRCSVAPPVVNFTYFESVDFNPKRVRIGQNLNITWTYRRGVNFPQSVLLSIFFASEYFEEYPQYVVANANATTGQYTLKVDQALRSFVSNNARRIQGNFPYRLYLQLTFPPQTNAVGGVIAPGNLTVLGTEGGNSTTVQNDRTMIWLDKRDEDPIVAPILHIRGPIDVTSESHV
ncbi:hypothetical protein DFS34DRAFT_607632 [Phlyctochytrium arcticum]|nr:hypothetical protein DFS34DRAFT_607632 [Phlyctochytrium arcticum]